MRKPIFLHKNYTLNEGGYQLKLPLNLETIIPEDDSVRLLSQFVEGMDLTCILPKYHKNDKKSAISFFAQNDKDTGRSMYEVFHQIHIKQQDPQRLCLPYIFLS